MSTRNCTIKFYLKNPPKSNPLQAPIYCRITYVRKKAEFFTGEKIAPSKWLEEAGMPKRERRLEEYQKSLIGKEMNLGIYKTTCIRKSIKGIL